MPELPEVENVCLTLRRVLQGHRIEKAEIFPDSIVYKKVPEEAIRAALEGRTVRSVGRKGKFWWLDFGEAPYVYGHLGMAGWVRELGAATIRLREHGKLPLDKPDGQPKFAKFILTSDEGKRVVFSDGRRLGRVWLGEAPDQEPRILQLGFDALNELPDVAGLQKLFGKRKAPIKALLLNQDLLSGIGNWIADEVLYQARIAPQRLGESLSKAEWTQLRKSILDVLTKAVEVGADKEQFPGDWIFHVRWDGSRGHDQIDGHPLIRETVGGRTTAWVPDLQK